MVVLPDNRKTLHQIFVGLGRKGKWLKGFLLIWHTVVWQIWKVRNPSHPSYAMDGHTSTSMAWQDFPSTVNYQIFNSKLTSDGEVLNAINTISSSPPSSPSLSHSHSHSPPPPSFFTPL